MLAQTYAGSTKALQEANGIDVLPSQLRRLGAERSNVHDLDADHRPKSVRLAVTSHCWMNEATERVLVEMMRTGVDEVGGSFVMPRGDAAILQGVDRRSVVKYMADRDVKVSVKELPKTWEDFTEAIRAAANQKGRNFHGMTAACEFKHLQEIEAARPCYHSSITHALCQQTLLRDGQHR